MQDGKNSIESGESSSGEPGPKPDFEPLPDSLEALENTVGPKPETTVFSDAVPLFAEQSETPETADDAPDRELVIEVPHTMPNVEKSGERPKKHRFSLKRRRDRKKQSEPAQDD